MSMGTLMENARISGSMEWFLHTPLIAWATRSTIFVPSPAGKLFMTRMRTPDNESRGCGIRGYVAIEGLGNAIYHLSALTSDRGCSWPEGQHPKMKLDAAAVCGGVFVHVWKQPQAMTRRTSASSRLSMLAIQSLSSGCPVALCHTSNHSFI